MTEASDYYNEIIDLRRELSNTEQLLKAAQNATAILGKSNLRMTIAINAFLKQYKAACEEDKTMRLDELASLMQEAL